MSKKYISDILTVVIVGLCCPFAMLFKPFSDLIKNENGEVSENE